MARQFFKQDAYDFYKKHILNIEKQNLLKKYNFPLAGSVSFVDWELFAAIFTGEKKRGKSGADLNQYEVKSAVMGNGFEYQYHLHSGVSKLEEDKLVEHIFVSYSRNYQDAKVRLVQGGELADIFTGWVPGLKKNYSGENKKQRYRKSISGGKIDQMGEVVMLIKGGVFIK